MFPEHFEKPHGAFSTPEQRMVWNERVMRVNEARRRARAEAFMRGEIRLRDAIGSERLEWYRTAGGRKYDVDELVRQNAVLNWINGKAMSSWEYDEQNSNA